MKNLLNTIERIVRGTYVDLVDEEDGFEMSMMDAERTLVQNDERLERSKRKVAEKKKEKEDR